MASERFMQQHYGASGFVSKRVGLHDIAVSGIWIRREADDVVLLAENPDNHQWVEIAREHKDGSFSHIVEPEGIRSRFAQAEVKP